MDLPFFLNMSHSLSDGIETSQLKYQNLLLFFTSSEMMSSYIFVGLLSFIYFVIRRSFKKKEDDSDKDAEVNKLKVRRIMLRNIYLVILIFGLFLIWKDEIKTAFFSISFAIMAIVVLWKEVIFNMISSAIISMSRMYSIGDLVEVKGKQGIVTDKTLFNTKILIKHQGLPTTQEQIVPNSFFITNEATLVTRFGHYTTQFVDVYVDKKSDLLPASKALKKAAEDVTLNIKDRANKMSNWRKKIKDKEGIDIPSHKPFVTIVPNDKPYLTLKFTCDNRMAFILKNEILEAYYSALPFTLHEYHERIAQEIKERFGEQKEAEVKAEPQEKDD